MAIEDLTTYTEEDPNSRISRSWDMATVAGLTRQESAWLVKDKGANHFDGDFEHQFEGYFDAAVNYGFCMIWALANTINDLSAILTASEDELAVYFYREEHTASHKIKLAESDGGSFAEASTNVALDTRYWFTVKRDESVGPYGTIYLYIYSDSGRTTQIAGSPLSIALHSSKKDFQYIYAIQSYNDGAAAHEISAWMKNLVLEFPPPEANTDPATEIEPRAAVLEATLVLDGGEECDCCFEWGETEAYGNTTPIQKKGGY